MTRIPRSHPRYASLLVRASLAEASRQGLVVPEGLIAHGRAEAFDYLLGERTTPGARRAERMAARYIAGARHPVLSVNGNVAALAARQVAALARAWPRLKVEINLFHRTPSRVHAVAGALRREGLVEVLGIRPSVRIPGLPSDRGRVDAGGIAEADLCVIPLEDGDRAEALKRWGVRVVAIDLNPLSRTARVADIPIIDELTRALGGITRELRTWQLHPPPLGSFPRFDATAVRHEALQAIRQRLSRSSVARPPPRAPARSARPRSRGTGRRSHRTP